MATMVLPQFPWYPVSGSAGNKKKGKKMSAHGKLTSYVLGDAYIQSGKTLTRTYR